MVLQGRRLRRHGFCGTTNNYSGHDSGHNSEHDSGHAPHASRLQIGGDHQMQRVVELGKFNGDDRSSPAEVRLNESFEV
jgi:hypothetical protein